MEQHGAASPGRGRARRLGQSWLGLVLLALVSGCSLPPAIPPTGRPLTPSGTGELLPEPGAARGGQAATPEDAGPMVTQDFAWTDFDRAQRTCRMTFPQRELEASREEFGCDPELLQPREFHAQRQIQYTAGQARDPAEMARLRAAAQAAMQAEIKAAEEEHSRQLLERGFIYIKAKTVAVDVARLWQWNIKRMRGPAAQLAAAADGDPVRAALSFVQEIRYEELRDTIGGRYVGGVLPPLETLAANCGDCDSKALLLASLLDDGAGTEVILLRGPKHMVAGIACDGNAGGFKVTAFGQSWQICECSHGVWEPGHIEAGTQNQIRRGEFTPVRLRQTGG